MIKNFTHLLPLLLLSFSTYGQNAIIDSLKIVLKQNPADSAKSRLLLEIGHQFKGVNIDSVDYYYHQSLQVADCEQCTTSRLNSLMALNLLKGFQKDTQCISYGIKAIAISKALNDVEKTTQILNALGLACLGLERIEQANGWLKQAAYLSKKNDLFLDGQRAHSNLGYIFTRKGIYDSGAVHLRTALAYSEKAGHKASHQALLNIGVVYFKSNNTEMAIEYYEKALRVSIEEKDRKTEAACYQNMGALYTKTEDLEKSLDYLTKANDIYQEQKDSSAMATYYASIADIHLKQNDQDKAFEAYLKAKEVFPSNGSIARKLFVHLNLSRTYLKRSKQTDKKLLEKAIEEGLIANELAHATLNTANQLESASILFKAYQSLQQFEKAATFASETIELHDSLLNEQKLNAIADVQEKYETEKRELEIELLNKDNALKDNALLKSEEASRRQGYILLVSLAGLLLAASIAILLLRLARQRKKANAELLEKNQTIASQNQEKELLLKEIHHRVKNNLQVVSSLLDLQSKKAGDGEKAALAEGQSRVRAMALIHEKLYQSKSVSEINFEEYCSQLSSQISQLFPNGKSVNCDIEVIDVSLDIDTAIPVGLILNELITNAYKYAFPEGGGSLKISAKKGEENGYILRVEDNGKGLPENFDWRKSKSLGLRLVNRLARQLYGTAEYTNSDRSAFEITFKDTLERKKIA